MKSTKKTKLAESSPVENEKSLNGEEGKSVKTIELLLARNGWKYLVKWKNMSDEENTWEHWTAIPKRILNVRIFSKTLSFIF